MNNKLILVGLAIIVVLAVAVGGFYFMNAGKPTTTPIPTEESTQTSTPQSEEEATPEAMSETEIIVEGSEFRFTPSTITVKKGEKVRLTYKNTGSVQHDFVVADLGVSTKRINPGQEETIEFIAQESGEFGFICSVSNHEELGMTGTLTAEE
ncbi:MAG: cupredoxin domain-containing protein [Candidatus Levybacteria bacterium]|nr:cupredoxin domain-containing protein [Candidatus Levybacteria bacterium]